MRGAFQSCRQKRTALCKQAVRFSLHSQCRGIHVFHAADAACQFDRQLTFRTTVQLASQRDYAVSGSDSDVAAMDIRRVQKR